MIPSFTSQHIEPNCLKDVEDVFHDDRLGIHANVLIESFNQENTQYEPLFEYGIKILNSLATRPDKSAASFFFVLNCLNNLAPVARDFATDAMVFCETSEDYDMSIGLDGLHKMYDDVRLAYPLQVPSSILIQFDTVIKKVIDLIEADQLEKARLLFNTEIPRFEEDLRHDTPLSSLISYYYDISDYLNKDSWRAIKPSLKEEIIGSYYSDYQEALKEALELEQTVAYINSIAPAPEAFRKIREEAKRNGTSSMSMEEINEEIAEVRRQKRNGMKK